MRRDSCLALSEYFDKYDVLSVTVEKIDGKAEKVSLEESGLLVGWKVTIHGDEISVQEKLFRTEQKELSLRAKENEIKERESRDESRFLREVRRTLENLVRELREGEITREKTLKVKKFIDDLNYSVETQEESIEKENEEIQRAKADLDRRLQESATVTVLENGMKIVQSDGQKSSSSSNKKTKKRLSNREALSQATSTYTDEEAGSFAPKKKAAPSLPPLSFGEGAQVLAGKSRARGTLVREERKGVWLVQLGSMRMSFKERDLTLVRPTSANTADYRIAPFSLSDLHLSYRREHLSFTLTLNNLLDTQYQVVQGYPMPGRNALLTVVFDW